MTDIELIAIELSEGRKEGYKKGLETFSNTRRENKKLKEENEELKEQLKESAKDIEVLTKENEEIKYALASSMSEQGFLEHKIENLKNGAEYKALTDMVDFLQKENDELKAQIEKMKCCENCNNHKKGKCTEDKMFYARTLKECSEWELSE